MSLSNDSNMVMPVTPAYGMGGMGYGNGMFGGDWFAWIILLLLFGGGRWGNNWGGGNDCGCCAPASCADLQRGFDNQSVMNKLNGIEQGISQAGYAALQQTSTLENGLCQLGYQTQTAINAASVNAMQDTNALSRQLADCCCENRLAICNLTNTINQGFNGVSNTICNTTRDVIDNQNSGINAIMSKLSQMEYNGLNDKYQAALAENQALKFQASQTAQNAFITANQEAQTAELLRRLGRDCPVPAYWVNPPTPVPVPCGTCNTCGC